MNKKLEANNHPKYWICGECEFRNNNILSPKQCIFCTNKWKCSKCYFFNNIKNYHCVLCESPKDNTSTCDSDSYSTYSTDNDWYFDDNETECSDDIKTLPKYKINLPYIIIPSKHNKLQSKTNKIRANEVKDNQYHIKLWEVLNTAY
eukprot:322630_1